MFNSSSPAERVCGKCRKKSKFGKRQDVMDCYQMTPAMERHIRFIEDSVSLPPVAEDQSFGEAVDRFLISGEDFDDSRVYEELEDFDMVETRDCMLVKVAEEALKPVLRKSLRAGRKDGCFEF
jgi:hypothetical protein